MTTIGFIGAGQMAQALAKGIAAADDTTKFVIADPSETSQQSFQNKVGSSVTVQSRNAEVFASCDIVFLSIKPQYLETAIDREQISIAIQDIDPKPLVVSIMAGVTIEKITSVTGLEGVVRVMPNTPSLILEGAAAMACSVAVSQSQQSQVAGLMSAVGCVSQVPENLIDAVTGVSGSGPAYVFTFIEALIDGGVLNGLPREVARELAIQTVVGSAKLVQQSGEHPAVLRDRVTSPGGTTIAALKTLEVNDFRGTIIQAVESATCRSKELGDG
jgi:pyrroline-5-carboxylate reductase